MIGDDGVGGHFRVDFLPVVDHWYQSLRRFCGKGKFNHIPGRGSAAEGVGSNYDIETYVHTTSEKDKLIATTALALDEKEMTYCLIARDCRAIEYCVLEKTLARIMGDAIVNAINDALK